MNIPFKFLKPYNKNDALLRKFWWNSNSNQKYVCAFTNWKDICKPKELGGLGFKSFFNMNRVLLTKLGWNLASNSNKILQ